MEDEALVLVTAVFGLIDVQQIALCGVLARLVEDIEDTLQMIAQPAMEQRYLHDDAAVGEAVDERVGQALRHWLAVVVLCLGGDVKHRLLNAAHAVAQQVDGNHGQGVLAIVDGGTVDGGHHVLLVAVLRAYVLAEAQQVAGQVGLL